MSVQPTLCFLDLQPNLRKLQTVIAVKVKQSMDYKTMRGCGRIRRQEKDCVYDEVIKSKKSFLKVETVVMTMCSRDFGFA